MAFSFVVGSTGAGKTTLVNLLIRFYEPDGVPLQSTAFPLIGFPGKMYMSSSVWCSKIPEFSRARSEITSSTIKKASPQDVVEACKAIGLHGFISTLPDGYDTILDETTTPSAGQRQLLTIARFVFDKVPMLILDEATSSVDTRTEVLIQKAMDRLMAGRTSFIIAHRLSTIRYADLIPVIDRETLLNVAPIKPYWKPGVIMQTYIRASLNPSHKKAAPKKYRSGLGFS